MDYRDDGDYHSILDMNANVYAMHFPADCNLTGVSSDPHSIVLSASKNYAISFTQYPIDDSPGTIKITNSYDTESTIADIKDTGGSQARNVTYTHDDRWDRSVS